MQTVSSSVRDAGGLKKGHWRCVLKVGGVTVASAVVQVA
jgi:hypothetical protein